MAEKIQAFKIDTDPAKKSIKDLRQELKGYKDDLVNLDKGTQEYNETVRKAADLQHQLKEMTEEVAASAMDAGLILSNSTKAINGIVGGITAVTGALSLFGIESENIGKVVKTLTSLLAIINGLKAIDESIKAFKRLSNLIKQSELYTKLFTAATKQKTAATNADTVATTGATVATNAFSAALVATGIGAIIVAIGLLAANWDSLAEAIGGSTDKLKEYNDELERLQGIEDKNQRILGYMGASTMEKLLQQLKDLNRLIEEALELLKEAEKIYNEASWWNKDAAAKAFNEVNAYLNGLIDKRQEVQWQILAEEGRIRDKEEAAALSAAEAAKKAADAKAKANAEAAAKSLEAWNKFWNEFEKKAENKGPIEKLIKERDSMFAGIDEAKQKGYIKSWDEYWQKVQAVSEHYTKAISDWIKDNKPTIDEEDDEIEDEATKQGKILADRAKAAAEAYKYTTTDFKTQYEQTLSDLERAERLNLMTHEEFLNAKANLDAEYTANLKVEANKWVSLYDQASNSIGNTLNNIADIYSAVNEKNGKVSKETLKRQQDMQIAATVISTLGGIASMTNSVWSSPDTGEFWAKLALQIVMTTEMLTSMGVQIAQIKNAASGSASSVASASSSAMRSISAPVQYTQDVQGAAIQDSINNQKVYVTESDITDTQRRVHVSESEARF